MHFLSIVLGALAADARLRPAAATDDEHLLFRSEDVKDLVASSVLARLARHPDPDSQSLANAFQSLRQSATS
jgi:hypothetical protein